MLITGDNLNLTELTQLYKTKVKNTHQIKCQALEWESEICVKCDYAQTTQKIKM